MEKEKHYCTLCGKEFQGWGNNPWPLSADGLCCDECNTKLVIPERIRIMLSK